MSQVKLKSKRIIACALSVLLASGTVLGVNAAYMNTNRDTRKAPNIAKFEANVAKEYKVLKETPKFVYYFRDDRDILAIKEKSTGYVWKTGIDVPFGTEIKDAHDNIASAYEDAKNQTDAKGKPLSAKEQVKYAEAAIKEAADFAGYTVDEYKKIAKQPVENSLNETFTAMANSLISIEYYQGEGKSMTKGTVSSAAKDKKNGVSAEITPLGDDKNEWKLECKFSINSSDLLINVYITLGDDGSIKYYIPNSEIEGKAKSKLADIMITPFLGASGGIESYYNEKQGDWSTDVKKYLKPGYAFVPDGSGALIRFADNKAKYSDYERNVYGDDPARSMYYYSAENDAVPIKDPVMPVFGVSQGNGSQSAFVAYAESGDEYMSINVTPSSEEKNKIKYTYAYPKFNYNSEYYQVTNGAGDSYRKTQDKLNQFDIDITYKFLYGNGTTGPKADYTGMAQAYRDSLIKAGVLKETEDQEEGSYIPIRIDFLMADSKKGVFSTKEVPVTTTKDIDKIINKLRDKGILNINSGLIGWQKKGETLAKPNSDSFSDAVGTKEDFTKLIEKFDKSDIDISFSREFTSINEDMVNYYGTAAKHLNTQYLELDKSQVLPENVPVTQYGYAKHDVSVEWLNDLYDSVGGISRSFTIDGISNKIITSHNSNGTGSTAKQVINDYRKAIKDISNDVKVNLVNPNKYLWQYTSRYLQAPVGTSQFVYETDTVPFLQMVLHGTMEIYAPYSNFSFYSKNDMLKMIDYNISPSFVLTQQPSYLLAATTSSDYYSTEFSEYESLIKKIYETVNGSLRQVIGYKWTGRKVLKDGVIVNTYTKGSNVKSVIINYTNDNIFVGSNKTLVAAQSAEVVQGGGF